VPRQDDRVRISVQLLRGHTDEHLWADTYDEHLDIRITPLETLRVTPPALIEFEKRSETLPVLRNQPLKAQRPRSVPFRGPPRVRVGS